MNLSSIIFAANVAASAALIYFSGAVTAETISISWTLILLVTFVVHTFIIALACDSLGYFLLGFVPVASLALHHPLTIGVILVVMFGWPLAGVAFARMWQWVRRDGASSGDDWGR